MAEERDLWIEFETNKYRKPTEEELDVALAAESRRKYLQGAINLLQNELDAMKKIKGGVFEDTAGFTYHTRTYIASGNIELI